MALEDEQAVTAESSPEPLPLQAAVSKKPKRLTLQERLAAAAKAKRKKAQQVLDLAPATTPETGDLRPDSEAEDQGLPHAEKSDLKVDSGEISASIQDPDEKVPLPGPEDVGKPDGTGEIAKSPTPVPNDTQSVDNPVHGGSEEAKPPLENGESEDTKKESLKDSKDVEIERLNSELIQLRAKVDEQAKEQVPKRMAHLATNDKKLAEKEKLLAQCEKKLLERENTVQQLMEEGQELSKKELKLNERIRTLVANNTKLESSLKSYAEKNEELLLKLGEIEDLVKVHKLKSVDQLFDVLAAANQKTLDLQAALDRQRDSNWEGKYKEMQRLYERELDEKKECKRQLSETNVQLELLQNQSRLELQSKTDIIALLNRELMASKDESSTEVLRLELKIESLRAENENFLKLGLALDNEHGDVKKLVDYADFLKLSDTHQNLQAQYVSSQENWKMIELSLLSKVDTLTASVDAMKRAKLKSAAELKKLHHTMNSQLEEIETLKSELARAIEEKSEQEFKTQMKINECAEMEEKIDELKSVFNSDRKNYDLKIKTLTDSIQELQNQTPTFPPSVSFDNLSLQGRRGVRDGGLHISMERPPVRKFSTHSLASLAMNTPAQIWEENSFEGADSLMYENHNVSSYSFNEEIYPYDAPEPGETPLSTSFASGATKNIQLINKMSSSIRRLEAEINALKDENEQLAAEKESAQREIVDRNELEQKLAALDSRISQLQHELDQKAQNEGTLLEVIGEKLEKVAELEADVADLKDLLRLQVQQMIEMQNK
ncbi:TATA element modulatory factor 1 DNA binding [Metschnikowia aff. pulcherrima]|uniref:TATA element modulatory factor 1 DNA binding n=1 Tax=Metschnikowia aff. pulcherrima TaxID=2163413 RepID=A0A4P6XPM7_9ASCO|nr:TATA element modulatory factor 1 DNA binding [Metschnikowia aff. pulcherrima]